MKETPILFKPWKVRKILDWCWELSNMETRRVIKPQPPHWKWNIHKWDDRCINISMDNREYYVIPPHGKRGDLMYVKEARSVEADATKSEIECGHFTYKADDYEGLWTKETGYKTLTPLFMPKWAARIWLEIVDVRVERLQDISEKDSMMEAVEPSIVGDDLDGLRYRAGFMEVWDKINAKKGLSWQHNPWVWVIEFKRVSKS